MIVAIVIFPTHIFPKYTHISGTKINNNRSSNITYTSTPISIHLNIEMTCETHQKSVQPSAKTCAPDLQRTLIHLWMPFFHPVVCPSICSSPKWDRNVQHSTIFAGMWVIWLHKFDSYRIINVEMQMKRGHPSAFVGASLLLLYVPLLV